MARAGAPPTAAIAARLCPTGPTDHLQRDVCRPGRGPAGSQALAHSGEGLLLGQATRTGEHEDDEDRDDLVPERVRDEEHEAPEQGG